MRLIINAIPLLGEESGIGNYARQIATAAANCPAAFDTCYFYGYRSRKLAPPQDRKADSWPGILIGLARNNTLTRKIAKKFLRFANIMADAIHPASWDCYFEPNFVFMPGLRAEKKILTIHDFSCFRFPEWHPAERVRYMEKNFWKSLEQADHIITVSQTVGEEATREYGISPDRITAIPNGVDHALFRPSPPQSLTELRKRYSLPENFVLYAGALEPRKNLLNLLEAHALLPRKLQERFPLLLIGSKGWNNSQILDRIRQMEQVRHLGYVPRNDLPLFYSAATLFAYPSWYEGFGLPPLEAMACGRAILTSTDNSLRELCGNAALYAEAGDTEGMAAQMQRLLEDNDLRIKLETDALARAALYSWEISTRRHLELFLKQTS